jgi:hypothetical protein
MVTFRVLEGGIPPWPFYHLIQVMDSGVEALVIYWELIYFIAASTTRSSPAR